MLDGEGGERRNEMTFTSPSGQRRSDLGIEGAELVVV